MPRTICATCAASRRGIGVDERMHFDRCLSSLRVAVLGLYSTAPCSASLLLREDTAGTLRFTHSMIAGSDRKFALETQWRERHVTQAMVLQFNE